MSRKHRSIVFYYFLLALLFSACSTPLKELVYLNEIKTEHIHNNQPIEEEYRIRPNDQLFIQVISDDPLNAAFLNIVSPQSTMGSMGSNTNSLELITFLVNEQGSIDYPQLGKINVEGLTTTELSQRIFEGVDEYLDGASVFVKLVNRTITVLGEVKNPGQKVMVKNQLSIFEALGSAGDMTDWGNRTNVKLIRELPEGKLVINLDMTDPELINSPYYYILPHDILYVENKTKVYGAKNMGYATPISILVSLLTLAALIVK